MQVQQDFTSEKGKVSKEYAKYLILPAWHKMRQFFRFLKAVSLTQKIEEILNFDCLIVHNK